MKIILIVLNFGGHFSVFLNCLQAKIMVWILDPTSPSSLSTRILIKVDPDPSDFTKLLDLLTDGLESITYLHAWTRCQF